MLFVCLPVASQGGGDIQMDEPRTSVFAIARINYKGDLGFIEREMKFERIARAFDAELIFHGSRERPRLSIRTSTELRESDAESLFATSNTFSPAARFYACHRGFQSYAWVNLMGSSLSFWASSWLLHFYMTKVKKQQY